jgi:hypothetical protein
MEKVMEPDNKNKPVYNMLEGRIIKIGDRPIENFDEERNERDKNIGGELLYIFIMIGILIAIPFIAKENNHDIGLVLFCMAGPIALLFVLSRSMFDKFKW